MFGGKRYGERADVLLRQKYTFMVKLVWVFSYASDIVPRSDIMGGERDGVRGND